MLVQSCKANGLGPLIDRLIEFCPKQTLAIQLYPTNAKIREKLAQDWEMSQGRCIAVNKESVHSHGNAAILLNKKSLEILIDPLQYFANYISKNWHPMLHPWRIRPVADNGCTAHFPRLLPSSYVSTFLLGC